MYLKFSDLEIGMELITDDEHVQNLIFVCFDVGYQTAVLYVKDTDIEDTASIFYDYEIPAYKFLQHV